MLTRPTKADFESRRPRATLIFSAHIRGIPFKTKLSNPRRDDGHRGLRGWETECPGFGNSALIKKKIQRDPLTLSPCKDTARRQHSMNQEVGSHQTVNLLVLWSQTSQLPKFEKYISAYKPHKLWYFCYNSPNDWI